MGHKIGEIVSSLVIQFNARACGVESFSNKLSSDTVDISSRICVARSPGSRLQGKVGALDGTTDGSPVVGDGVGSSVMGDGVGSKGAGVGWTGGSVGGSVVGEDVTGDGVNGDGVIGDGVIGDGVIGEGVLGLGVSCPLPDLPMPTLLELFDSALDLLVFEVDEVLDLLDFDVNELACCSILSVRSGMGSCWHRVEDEMSKFLIRL